MTSREKEIYDSGFNDGILNAIYDACLSHDRYMGYCFIEKYGITNEKIDKSNIDENIKSVIVGFF